MTTTSGSSNTIPSSRRNHSRVESTSPNNNNSKSHSSTGSTKNKTLEKAYLRASSTRASTTNTSRVVEETETLVASSLLQLDDRIKEIDLSLKTEFVKAQDEYPHLVDRNHKLMFLRCEAFDTELAALRLVHYWSKRVALFGEEDAYAPLSIHQSLRNDMTALSMGSFVWTGQYDGSHNRGIFIDDLGKFDRHFEQRAHHWVRERSMTRVWWYLLETALQEDDERVQRHGITYIMVARPFSPWRNFHLRLARAVMDLLAFALPIRIAEIHIGRPNGWFRLLNVVLFQGMLAQRPRIEEIPLHFHIGTPAHVGQRLAQRHAIPLRAIPESLGGQWQWDHAAWIRQRLEAGL